MKILDFGIDKYNHYVVEYMCQGKGGILPTKKKVNKEINKNGKENWKLLHCCGHRVYR